MSTIKGPFIKRILTVAQAASGSLGIPGFRMHCLVVQKSAGVLGLGFK